MKRTLYPLHKLPASLLSITALLLWSLLPLSVHAATTFQWDGGAQNSKWASGANWTINSPPTPNSLLLFTGVTQLNNINNFAPGTPFNGITFASAGLFNLSGTSITLDGGITNNQPVSPQTITLNMGLGVSPNLNLVPSSSLVLGGVISSTVAGTGLVLSGGGQVTLNGVNTYTGGLVDNGDTLVISADSGLGAAPSVPTPGSIVLNGGTLKTSSTFAINTNRGITLGPVGSSGSGTFDVSYGQTVTYRGIIANNTGGADGLSKLSFGGLTLAGSNSYTGPTAIMNGLLTLDFTQAGASPTNNVINPASALSLGGATAGIGVTNSSQLFMQGRSATSNSQTFASTVINSGAALIRATNGASSGKVGLALGALTHVTGGAVTIIPPNLGAAGVGSITTTTGNFINSSNQNTGILGGWAYIGDGSTPSAAIQPVEATNLACVVNGVITNYSAYTKWVSTFVPNVGPYLNTIMFQSNNIMIDGPNTLGDVQVDAAHPTTGTGTTNDVNTVTINRPAGAPGSSFSMRFGTNNVLRLGKYGAIFAQQNSTGSDTWEIGDSTAGANTTADQNSGTLTAGGPTYNTPGELVLIEDQTSSASNGNLDVDVQIADNGPGGQVTFVKGGPGYVKIRGHNTFTGGTYYLQGRIQFAGSDVGTTNPDALGTGPAFVFPGAYCFAPPPAFTNALFIAGNGTQQEALGAIRASGAMTNTVTLIGDASIGGSGGNFIGQITGPFNLIIGSGTTVQGSVQFSNPTPPGSPGTNNWTGNTTIQASSHAAGVNSFLNGTNGVIPHGFGYGNVLLAGLSATQTATWNLNGWNQTINGLGNASFNTQGTAVVPAWGIVTNSSATPSTLTLGDNDVSLTFSGPIGGAQLSLTKTGAGTETLAGTNTYAGNTTINNGTLAIGLGGNLVSSANVIVNSGGTLDITGDVSGGTTPLFKTPNVALSGGTLSGNTANPGITGTLGMTNGALSLIPNTALTNVYTATLNTGGTTNVVNILGVAGVSGYPTTFSLVQYSGASGGTFNIGIGSVPSASTGGYVSNDTLHSRIVLVLTNGPKLQVWTGAADLTTWDLNNTANWQGFGQPPADTFNQADTARFDDSALAGATNVNLEGATSFLPESVIVSNTLLNYTLLGTNAISGSGGLSKLGNNVLTVSNTGVSDFHGGINVGVGTVVLATDNSISGGATISNAATLQVGTGNGFGLMPSGPVDLEGALVFNRGANLTASGAISGGAGGSILKSDAAGTLTLSGANSFTGAVTVAAGILQAGSSTALGATNGATTINSGATLDVNNLNLGFEPINVVGTGVGGNGAIINGNPTGETTALKVVNVTGNNVTFGGAGRWDIRETTTTVGSETLDATLTGLAGTYTLNKVGLNQVSLVGVTVDGNLGDIDVNQGQFDLQLGVTSLGNSANTINVAAGATLGIYDLTAAGLSKNITLNGDGVTTTLTVENGAASVLNGPGPVQLNGNCIVSFADSTGLTLNQGITGAGGSLTQSGATSTGGTLTLGGTLSYAGSIVVNAGTLNLQALNTGGSISNAPGTTVTGNYGAGSTGPVTINGTLAPGGVNSGGIFNSGALTINTNATLLLDIGSSSDQIVANGSLTVNGTNTVFMVPQVGTLASGGTTVILTYTGAALPHSATNQFVVTNALPGYVFALVDPQLTAGSPNNLVITNVHVPVVQYWKGGSAPSPSQWDYTTLNWYSNTFGGPLDTFSVGDQAVFQDGATTSTVSLTNGSLEPVQVKFNAGSTTYTLNGHGYLTGPMQMLVNGGSPVIIANSGNSNDFTGGVTVSAGSLQLGNGDTNGTLGSGGITNFSTAGPLIFNRTDTLTLSNMINWNGNSINQIGSGITVLAGNCTNVQCAVNVNNGTLRIATSNPITNNFANLTVASGATLDLYNGQANLQQLPVTVSGSGVGGNGAIINGSTSGSAAVNANQYTLVGNTTFGGTGRLDIRDENTSSNNPSISTGGNPYSITKVGTNYFALTGVQIDPALTNFYVSNGTMSFQLNTGSPGGSVFAGGGFGNPLGGIYVASNAAFSLYQLSNHSTKVLILQGGAAFTNENGLNFWSGNVQTTGSNIIGVAGTSLEVDGQISGNGGIFKAAGSPLILTSNELYTGPTWVNSGTLVLSNIGGIDASISTSSAITNNSSTIDVSGLSTQTLTTPAAQILSGPVTVDGSLAVNGPFSPGTLGSGTGTVVATNNVAIGATATTFMSVIKSSATVNTNTLVAATNAITAAGTLTVTNVGFPLQGGEIFQLFKPGNAVYSGLSFSTVTLPALGPGLTWQNNLSTAGTITVLGTLTAPTISSVSVSGTTLSVSGTGGTPYGQYLLLTTQNITNALSTWTKIATNNFTSSGTFSTTTSATNAQQYFTISE
jgi:fibronectin-binding autotransporter adhesin